MSSATAGMADHDAARAKNPNNIEEQTWV